jgi:ADP-ribose pyrophosphatase YjhB (NUDIX family)
MTEPTSGQLVRWAEALAGVARTGLAFTTSTYEAERYEEVLTIAADIRHTAEDAAGGRRQDTIEQYRTEWLRSIGSGRAGYVTPKTAVGAVVGDDQGRLLLIQRADSGTWLYPTGWADVGYSPAEVAVKEVLEETGIRCEVVRPLAIIDGLRAGFSRVPLVSLVFHCRATGGEVTPHPVECRDAGWFSRGELPDPLANGSLWVDHAFAAIDGLNPEVLFDRPRSPVWRGPSGP